MNLNSGPKNSPLCQVWAWSSNYLENNSSFFVFPTQKMMWHTENKRLLWQHLITMVIDKICKMIVKGVELKSESFFPISHGVLELWRKNLREVFGTTPFILLSDLQSTWNLVHQWVWLETTNTKNCWAIFINNVTMTSVPIFSTSLFLVRFCSNFLQRCFLALQTKTQNFVKIDCKMTSQWRHQ